METTSSETKGFLAVTLLSSMKKKVLRIEIPWVSTIRRQMLKSIQFTCNAKICPVSSRYGLVLRIKRLGMDKRTLNNNNNNEDDEDDDGEDNADVRFL